ncbi:MAG: peptidoglycan DD-metalloendopeptidase family protein [Pseudomonadales bacterium]|nr:peptidoglycan DD-metalloendopeptidase family protein [Pseudomonadales bacterium]
MQFPRAHLILIFVLSLGLTAFVFAKLTEDSEDMRFNTDATLAAIPDAATLSEDTAIEEAALQTGEVNTAIEPADAAPPAPPKWQATRTEVRPGDNLALIFKRHGLSPTDVYAVSNAQPLGKRLRSIFPGHELTLYQDEAGQLMQVDYASGPLDTLIYEREGKLFTSHQVTAEPDRILAYKHGVIDHSLFVASQRAGLTDNLTMRLAQIFQWDVDFVLDIRPGDAFYVLFEELFHENEFVGYGEILAAEFVNQGDHHRAILYTDDAGDKDYFSPNGTSMRKAFLRAPVEFSRISSNFNLRRVHPLFKTVRPHRGIDYAAPRGTPILAAGDGRVTRASRTKPNGNYVVIQHGEQFVTKYLHLSKFGRGIKSGAKVQQGQTIGYVGATGWATAAHLHYEFLVNGVHQNPRTVSLPDAQPIASSEMPRFKQHAAEFAAKLDTYKTQVAVALAR